MPSCRHVSVSPSRRPSPLVTGAHHNPERSDSEDLLGKWFKKTGNRSKIFLATKFANCSNEKGERWVDSSPEYVKKACAKSLERLGIDQIDLYYWWVVRGRS